MKRPTVPTRQEITRCEKVLLVVAAKNGWQLKTLYRSRRTFSVYLSLWHPRRGKIKVRIADHVANRPMRFALHCLVGLDGSLPVCCRWLNSSARACRLRKVAA